MKFLHTSDWHLGRRFHNVSLLEDQRHVLNQLVEYAATEAVDAVVVAGDIYDRSIPPAAAVELLDDTLHRLCHELAIAVIMIPGNHDSAERLRFGARQFRQAGLHILADLDQVAAPVMVEGKHGDAADFYGIPYNDPETVRSRYGVKIADYHEAHAWLADRIRAAMRTDTPNILISHCFLAGGEISESERPLSIGGADQVAPDCFGGFDYVALGHLHGPQRRTAEHIRYSGSLLKYSFSEQHHKKGVTLVELAKGDAPEIRQLPLNPLRDLRIIEGGLADLLEQGRDDPQHEDYLLVRLTDQHAILDPMGKLREVYPNVLHLEKPGMLAQMAGTQTLNCEKLKHGELAMCRDFFLQMAGHELTEEQDKVLCEVIDQIHQPP